MSETTTDEQRGARRRLLRQSLQLSAAALAEKAGVGRGTVWNAEQGKDVKSSSLSAIASAIGVPLAVYADPPVPVLS